MIPPGALLSSQIAVGKQNGLGEQLPIPRQKD